MCGQPSHFHVLVVLQKSFCASVYKDFENSTHVQYGIKQQQASHETMNYLKGVVSKTTQVECGQVLS